MTSNVFPYWSSTIVECFTVVIQLFSLSTELLTQCICKTALYRCCCYHGRRNTKSREMHGCRRKWLWNVPIVFVPCAARCRFAAVTCQILRNISFYATDIWQGQITVLYCEILVSSCIWFLSYLTECNYRIRYQYPKADKTKVYHLMCINTQIIRLTQPFTY